MILATFWVLERIQSWDRRSGVSLGKNPRKLNIRENYLTQRPFSVVKGRLVSFPSYKKSLIRQKESHPVETDYLSEKFRVFSDSTRSRHPTSNFLTSLHFDTSRWSIHPRHTDGLTSSMGSPSFKETQPYWLMKSVYCHETVWSSILEVKCMRVRVFYTTRGSEGGRRASHKAGEASSFSFLVLLSLGLEVRFCGWKDPRSGFPTIFCFLFEGRRFLFWERFLPGKRGSVCVSNCQRVLGMLVFVWDFACVSNILISGCPWLSLALRFPEIFRVPGLEIGLYRLHVSEVGTASILYSRDWQV